MSQDIKDALIKFKAYTAGIIVGGDTLALDKALGEASTLLYDIRQMIDDEWRAARRPLWRITTFKAAPKSSVTLSDLGLTEKE